MSDYATFIANKRRVPKSYGFDVAESGINQRAFDWQRLVIKWAIKRGRAALFEECGMGKTLQQLEFARLGHRMSGKPAILLCPVGVRSQTRNQAAAFGLDCDVAVVDRQADVVDGINITNYEKLHHFDASKFDTVVLDESSILKCFTGKTKRLLCDTFRETPYRLACTATPAPNDHMELGNHADFLGVMPSNEMLSRWFINDTMKAGGYRLKGHAEQDFWQWVASWAVCLSKPSDIGFANDGFILPALNVNEYVAEVPPPPPSDGMLFAADAINATTIHEEKRRSAGVRAGLAAQLIAQYPNDAWLLWCDTNYEADALSAVLPQAIEVRGSDSESDKEAKLAAFSGGNTKQLITKAEIAGFGMNWQHCSRMIFVGLGYSFERYYQAVRRCWRFGQANPVDVHIISTPAEQAASSAVWRKQRDHEVMQSRMADAMRLASMEALGLDRTRDRYEPTQAMTLPAWMRGEAA